MTSAHKNQVELARETVQLARLKAKATGTTLKDELARQAVYESVLNLDAEENLLIDEEKAFSNNDALVAALGVNDLSINDSNIDIRALENGQVNIDRALSDTTYMQNGTIVVDLKNQTVAEVAAYVSQAEWREAQSRSGGDILTVAINEKHKKDLLSLLHEISKSEKMKAAVAAPAKNDLFDFVTKRDELSQSKQKEIIEAILANNNCWEDLENILQKWSKPNLKNILTESSAWNEKLNQMVQVLSPKFSRLNTGELKSMIAKAAEGFGDQIYAWPFRQTLYRTLVYAELSRNLKGSMLQHASQIADQVLAGSSVQEAVKKQSKNQFVLDIALKIKSKRKQVVKFIEASGEEIASAFQQLAVQPVYATHSLNPDEGIEAINEALAILDAGDFAASLKEIDSQLE